MQVVFVEKLERFRGKENQDHERVRPEATLPQEDEQPKHQDRGELDAAELGDSLEDRVQ